MGKGKRERESDDGGTGRLSVCFKVTCTVLGKGQEGAA